MKDFGSYGGVILVGITMAVMSIAGFIQGKEDMAWIGLFMAVIFCPGIAIWMNHSRKRIYQEFKDAGWEE